jgi:hypothetical protein
MPTLTISVRHYSYIHRRARSSHHCAAPRDKNYELELQNVFSYFVFSIFSP